MAMNETAFFERHVSKKSAKLLAQVASPTQMAQTSKLQTDLAYATAQQRIDAAKIDCEMRRKRKAMKQSQP